MSEMKGKEDLSMWFLEWKIDKTTLKILNEGRIEGMGGQRGGREGQQGQASLGGQQLICS